MHRKIEQSETFFDLTAAAYDAEESHSGRARELYPLIVERAQAAGFDSLLDIACGTGAMLLAISQAAPSAHLVGVDLSSGMLEVAAKRLEGRAKLLKSDATRLPLDDASFDVITCNHAFHHFPDPANALREWRRVLRPNGTIIIGENRRPLLKRLYWNLRFKTDVQCGDVKFYSQSELVGLLESAGFEQVSYTALENHNCIVQGFRADTPGTQAEMP